MYMMIPKKWSNKKRWTIPPGVIFVIGRVFLTKKQTNNDRYLFPKIK